MDKYLKDYGDLTYQQLKEKYDTLSRVLNSQDATLSYAIIFREVRDIIRYIDSTKVLDESDD